MFSFVNKIWTLIQKDGYLCVAKITNKIQPFDNENIFEIDKYEFKQVEKHVKST